MATTWRMDHPRYWGSSWDGIFPFFLLGKYYYKGVSKNRGGPPKWMVKIMENPIKMDDLGVPVFSETSISPQAVLFGYKAGTVKAVISRMK